MRLEESQITCMVSEELRRGVVTVSMDATSDPWPAHSFGATGVGE